MAARYATHRLAPRPFPASAAWLFVAGLVAFPSANVPLTAAPPAQQAAAPPAAPEGAETAAAAPARPDRHPELKRLSRTDEVWVDKERKEVVVGAEVVLDKGGIEVFACLQKTKEHEAVVATRSTARLVHAALLAIGLDPGSPVSFDPEYVPAKGPAVRVRVRWKDAEGKQREALARDWIRDSKTGRALDTDWVFAGSSFWRDPADGTEYYQADGGDLICVSNFPTATLDLPLKSSESNEDLLFEVFEGRVPPRGTEVDLILSAAK
jgi:hypothetical protein